jgi:hypothetical protein
MVFGWRKVSGSVATKIRDDVERFPNSPANPLADGFHSPANARFVRWDGTYNRLFTLNFSRRSPAVLGVEPKIP